MSNTIPITVTVTHNIPQEDIANLLCCAIEGDSNRWCESCDRMGDIPKEKAPYRHQVPFVLGGWLRFIECEPSQPADKLITNRYYDTLNGERVECYRLDLDVIKRGLEIMSRDYPTDFGDFINGDEDARTGDLFLQCCLFGEDTYS